MGGQGLRYEYHRTFNSSTVYQGTEGYKLFSSFAPLEFRAWINDAYAEDPSLFGAKLKAQDTMTLYLRLATVFGAWELLKSMLNSGQTWNEADYATACVSLSQTLISNSRVGL